MTAQTILPANSAASGGFEVANSIRLNENAYLHKTPSGSGNRKTWTASVWVKGQPTTTTNNIAGQAVFSAGDSATDRTHFYFTNGIFEFRTEISNTPALETLYTHVNTGTESNPVIERPLGELPTLEI